METKTYTNRRKVAMDLVEVKTAGSKHTDPLHAYTIAPGASIELRHVPGIRRVWVKA